MVPGVLSQAWAALFQDAMMRGRIIEAEQVKAAAAPPPCCSDLISPSQEGNKYSVEPSDSPFPV